MEEGNMLLLLQLSDSAFPVGGFSYSSGMESALKQGFLKNGGDLRNYLVSYAEQVMSFEFPYICSSHAMESLSAMGLLELQTAYRAMLLNPPLCKASAIIGSNWMKIMRQLITENEFQLLDAMLLEHSISYEFPVVFGLSMKAAGFTLKQSLFLFFHMSLRDQMSAMIRLSITGPFMAHKEFKCVMDHFTPKVNTYIPLSYEHASKSAYLLELIQLTHHRVYSKLFQN